MPIQDDLREILVCPLSKAELVYDAEADTLTSTDRKTRRRYRIEDDIPIMLADDDHSEELPQDEWEAIMRAHGREDVL
ncbi:hypothetical protein HN371_05125 [Candidatus Poribacteria bacterium]|jgi:uncharacterized protein|nr:hypothetical protein [Candidatus Poribacteria bacterium]MBT5531596.1 hypothetical protein [Candidatus Poribacteria bacterium]MBT5709781.1 hypothetical protein [Candidatus Poribacteria bacterium]MBT7097016.1 hypothetical protein [Candidatus Poribacteria bacterium]MBT7805749.1 hypothetical protein [Candidatus Poribacteria bacterium]